MGALTVGAPRQKIQQEANTIKAVLFNEYFISSEKRWKRREYGDKNEM